MSAQRFRVTATHPRAGQCSLVVAATDRTDAVRQFLRRCVQPEQMRVTSIWPTRDRATRQPPLDGEVTR